MAETSNRRRYPARRRRDNVCPSCNTNERPPHKAYCVTCQNAYNRQWRALRRVELERLRRLHGSDHLT